jgi:FtsP/CotA-like multicopper oxidase with cupredoxin domain
MTTASRGGLAARVLPAAALALIALAHPHAFAQGSDPADAVCPRYAPGSVLPAPPELFSQNHALEVTLTLQTVTDAQGLKRYCYTTGAGEQAPTLHVLPGDQLVIHLINALPAPPLPPAAMPPASGAAPADPQCVADPMGPQSTNLHFHGMNLPPTCHQDDVIGVLVQPAQTFDYTVKIPADEPPGLYWYHPHPHGFSQQQVLGGAAGALIVEGIESAVPATAGLTQRVLVLRDQKRPGPWSPVPGAPALDLSLNFVPIAYPAYTVPLLQSAPATRELWRVLNASADEILDLEYQVGGSAQPLTIIGVDGVPVGSGTGGIRTLTDTHFLLGAGGRVEFIVTTPAAGSEGELVTRPVDAGPAGLPYPARPLLRVSAGGTSSAAALAHLHLAPALPTRRLRFARLAAAAPDAQRRLYFSEAPTSPGHLGYFITVEGRTPKVYDMSAPPDLTLHQGTVEDWRIENRSDEDHVFHIHQLHFKVLAHDDAPVDDPALRDTINVPHWSGAGPFPSVTLRMDFRNPDIVGTFVYHCHLLGHEDAGMMASLALLPAGIATATALVASRASVNANAPLTLTATVTPQVAGTPVNGSVQFALDGVPLGAAVAVAPGGAATLDTAVEVSGAHTLTAAYSGDADCNESLSSPLALSVEDFALSAPPIALVAGGTGTSALTIAGTAGFDSPVTLSCALPDSFPGATCELSPASLSGSGSARLTVATSAFAAAARGGVPVFAGVLLLVAHGGRRRGRAGRARRLAWLLLPLLALGCTSGHTGKSTPPGSYEVRVSASATQGTAQLTHELTVPVQVH